MVGWLGVWKPLTQHARPRGCRWDWAVQIVPCSNDPQSKSDRPCTHFVSHPHRQTKLPEGSMAVLEGTHQ